MRQTIRIIGGEYRGKKIPFLLSPGLRPTTDRIKETLFNWLMHEIQGARCLDAFAGSGALGFEAFSRGASQVTLLESSWPVYQQLLKVAATFKSRQTDLAILSMKAETYLTTITKPFDIIFFDPPFAEQGLDFYLQLLLKSPLLTADSLVYLESAHKPVLSPLHWQELKSKSAGQVFFGLYKKSA